MFNKKIISSLCIFTLLNTLNADEISLKELINIAIENNSNIKISKLNEDKQKASYDLSKSNYLPKISAQGEFSNYKIKSNGASLNDSSVTGITLSASQLLYDFGKTSSQIESAKDNFEASKFETVKNISSTVLKTKQAYYSILNNYQQIELANESIKIDKLHLNQAENYFNAGVRTLIDVTDAKLQLSNSKLSLIKSNYSLKNSQTNLITILGLDKNKEFLIKRDSKIKFLAKNITKEETTLEQLLENGYKNRAELKIYQKQIEAQNLQLKSTNKEYFPRIDFNASYSDKNSNDIASLDSEQTVAGVYLKWDIFTGNSTQANVKTALSNLKTLKQQLVQEKLQIREDITNAYLKVKENEESINISLLNVNLATQKLNLANQRYKAGLNDLVEVNDSKLQYTKAKSQLIDSYYNYLNAKANLDYATGIIY